MNEGRLWYDFYLRSYRLGKFYNVRIRSIIIVPLIQK